MRTLLALLALLVAGSASASPNLPLDDPAYERLAILRAQGRLPFYDGIRPLTEYQAQRLLLQAGSPGDPNLWPIGLRGFWIAPARRLTVRLGGFDEDARPYSVPARWLGMAGSVSYSCEHQEGRPCGGGGGGLLELDSAAGWGRYVSAFTRLQLMAGSGAWRLRGAVDRAYLNAELGPVAVLVGRDVLALGPGVHTQLLWGDHAPPLDQVRLQTARPLRIPRLPLTVSALYAVGRLRDPQTFHGTLVTLARLQVAIADQLELGAQQLLQLGGEGAIRYDFAHFVGEHFTRTGGYGGAGGSNRRDSLEAVYTNKWARGLRLYYELAFEDFRKQAVDMFLYDCDHLFGFELPALTRDGHHGLVVELQHNGPFSQEHTYFTTGLTNAGRAVGAPLGPDSWSVYGQSRIDLGRVTLYGWFEWALTASDQWSAQEYGPIIRIARGVDEQRWRWGLFARVLLHPRLRAEVRALYEHVHNEAFVRRASADHGGVEARITWTPWP